MRIMGPFNHQSTNPVNKAAQSWPVWIRETTIFLMELFDLKYVFASFPHVVVCLVATRDSG